MRGQITQVSKRGSGGTGLWVLERRQPGPWGPRDEPADWDPGVSRAQGWAALGPPLAGAGERAAPRLGAGDLSSEP